MNSLVVIYLEAEYVSLTDLECSRPAQFRSARHGSDGRRHLANRPHPVQYEEPTEQWSATAAAATRVAEFGASLIG